MAFYWKPKGSRGRKKKHMGENNHQKILSKKEKHGRKLRSWQEIGSDGNTLWKPCTPHKEKQEID